MTLPLPLLLPLLAVGVALAVPLHPASTSASSCPPAVSLRVCDASCDSDADCPGVLVCCATGCGGTACVRRVASALSQQRQRAPQAKPGTCPAPELGSWVCSHRCRDDFDCVGASKCCRNRCGALACMPPE